MLSSYRRLCFRTTSVLLQVFRRMLRIHLQTLSTVLHVQPISSFIFITHINYVTLFSLSLSMFVSSIETLNINEIIPEAFTLLVCYAAYVGEV
jgi:hypothetical protein